MNKNICAEFAINKELGSECDIAISTRIRLARNYTDMPFPVKLNAEGRKQVVEKTKDIISSFKDKENFKFLNADELSAAELTSVMENRIVSPDFVKAPNGKELIYNNNENLYVMVNEEDHLRIQFIMSGFSLDSAFENTMKFDDFLQEKADVAFHETLGFLTQCPTNLGTGMRASVMIHLPALRMTHSINQLAIDLSKLGLTIRGLYGENTDANGDLYQISNQVTLGISENEIIEKMKTIISKILQLERQAREEIKKKSNDHITDKIMRSYGTFTNAHMIKGEEFLNLYSDIRLGITYGLIKNIDYKTLDKLLTELMLANIQLKYDLHLISERTQVDILRAKIIKETLRG